MTDARLRYKVNGDDRWIEEGRGPEAKVRERANALWQLGAREVQILQITETVVAHKRRSPNLANIDL